MADAGRARKIADRIKTLIAANVESIVKDPDLGFITITDVRVTGDLQHASVFYTVFGDETQRAKTAALLEQNKGRLRSFVGGQIQIRLTPSLDFFADAIPETAAHLEELLREAKERDEAVAAAAAGATYAGESDPYRKPEPDDDTDDTDLGDTQLEDTQLEDTELEDTQLEDTQLGDTVAAADRTDAGGSTGVDGSQDSGADARP